LNKETFHVEDATRTQQMTHKIREGRVEEHAYYANKLRENVGLDT